MRIGARIDQRQPPATYTTQKGKHDDTHKRDAKRFSKLSHKEQTLSITPLIIHVGIGEECSVHSIFDAALNNHASEPPPSKL